MITLLAIIRIWNSLSLKRKSQVYLLIFIMICSGFAELLSLGSVIPFLMLLQNPDSISSNPLISTVFSYLPIFNQLSFLLSAILLFTFVTIVAVSIRLVNLWLNSRLSSLIITDISVTAFSFALRRPYLEHIFSNSSDLVNALTLQISRSTSAASAVFQLLTSMFVVTFIIAGLIAFNWKICLFLFVFVSLTYSALVSVIQYRLLRNSKLIEECETTNIRTVQESLYSIREIIMEDSFDYFIDFFNRNETKAKRLTSLNQFYTGFPKFVLESLGILLISWLGVYLISDQSSSSFNVVSVMGVLAIASQRLLPASQQIYSCWAQIKGCSADLSSIAALLPTGKRHFIPTESYHQRKHEFEFKDRITFKNVSFRYEPETPYIFKDLNLTICAGDCIGIVGTTGSGKSTFVDLLMGLLEPTSGQIYIDGKLMSYDSTLFSEEHTLPVNIWRSCISHVPQSIFLYDSDIGSNITLDFTTSRVTENLLTATKSAHLTGLIEGLPLGLSTPVGERGLKLSGGQRQRIGIARAIYKGSSLLIMDEATSALDSATETIVVDKVCKSEVNKTIIMVAHRLSSLARCNKFISVSDGSISIHDTLPA